MLIIANILCYLFGKRLSAEEKRVLYETGKQMLDDLGYVEIGMDHFALKTDALYKAQETQEIHRNFMGYSSSKTQVMVGLGVSSIGDSWNGFAQNVKTIEEYYSLVNNDVLPVCRGHILTAEDVIIRQHILNLMCKFETSWHNTRMNFPELPDILYKLKPLVNNLFPLSTIQTSNY